MPDGQDEDAVTVPLRPTKSDLYWRSIFNKYDKNNDGQISYVELKNIIESTEYEHDLPDNVVEKIMNCADTDQSGFLDFYEFVEMMYNPAFKAVFGHFFVRYVYTIIPRRQPSSIDFKVVKTSKCVGAYENEYTCWCWPPAVCMIIISLVEVIVFCYDDQHQSKDSKNDSFGPLANIFMYCPDKRQEAWRFITYMLVHMDKSHLLYNLLVQLFLGVPLEIVHRWWRVTLVYLAGVASGSLAASLVDPRPLIGASGGVYAMITAHVATLIMNWSEMEMAVVQLLVFISLGALGTGEALYNRYWQPHNLPSINTFMTHLGGAVAGLLIGIGVLRNLETRKWEKRVWWAAVTLYFSLMIAGILANIFWNDHFSNTSPNNLCSKFNHSYYNANTSNFHAD